MVRLAILYAVAVTLALCLAGCQDEHVTTDFFDPNPPGDAPPKLIARQEIKRSSFLTGNDTPATNEVNLTVETPGGGTTTLSATQTGPSKRPPTTMELTAGRLDTLMWAGIGAMAIGLGLLVLKKWVPVLPTTAGTYTMLMGGAMVAASVALAAIPTWVWIGMALAGVTIVGVSYLATRRDKKKLKAAKTAERSVA
jgi:hypothetical protein